ncbi:hypothetical protein [Gordonia sp. (in: high G+C Gram-positive bacteria)]|uniref:hypothetical protein n=1 Tax=Gordonia sp. (in: high G+C Gram-positive bacteria) TaxID=84139 RepID=UPI00168EBFB0|nr:hypothetical protein [Gordonia sp. (in: high G+C Gram-positive bacteria)]NLG47207.1 hypothetical protein [Gordonia sp. (in: high G+C Gram-positive bacteria)]
MRQTLGFAVLGAAVALLAATLGSGLSSIGSPRRQILDASFAAMPTAAEQLVSTGVLGAVVGGLVGAVLWGLGFSMAGAPDNRIARVVFAGLVGAAVGVGVAVFIAFGNVIDSAPTPATVLAIYAACGLVAYGLALVAIAVVLRLSGDSAVRSTVRAAAVALIPGAAVATGAGVGAAWILGFATTEGTWVASSVAVLLVLAATVAIARAVAIRGR